MDHHDTTEAGYINCAFVGNTAGVDGGAANATSNSNCVYTNCTFTNNSAGSDGGAIRTGVASSTYLSNNIFQNNPGNQELFGPVDAGSSNNLLEGGTLGGPIVLITDPQFIQNPDPGDGDWTTLADNDYGDLRLKYSSPCIDAGTNTADLDGVGAGTTLISDITEDIGGKDRIQNATVDLGVYEWGSYPGDLYYLWIIAAFPTATDPEIETYIGSKLMNYGYGMLATDTSTNPLSQTGLVLNSAGFPAPFYEPSLTGLDLRTLFTRITDYQERGLKFTVQFSGDMTFWSDSIEIPSLLDTDSLVELVSVTYPTLLLTPTGVQKAKFFRVRVELIE